MNIILNIDHRKVECNVFIRNGFAYFTPIRDAGASDQFTANKPLLNGNNIRWQWSLGLPARILVHFFEIRRAKA